MKSLWDSGLLGQLFLPVGPLSSRCRPQTQKPKNVAEVSEALHEGYYAQSEFIGERVHFAYLFPGQRIRRRCLTQPPLVRKPVPVFEKNRIEPEPGEVAHYVLYVLKTHHLASAVYLDALYYERGVAVLFSHLGHFLW